MKRACSFYSMYITFITHLCTHMIELTNTLYIENLQIATGGFLNESDWF